MYNLTHTTLRQLSINRRTRSTVACDMEQVLIETQPASQLPALHTASGSSTIPWGLRPLARLIWSHKSVWRRCFTLSKVAQSHWRRLSRSGRYLDLCGVRRQSVVTYSTQRLGIFHFSRQDSIRPRRKLSDHHDNKHLRRCFSQGATRR